MCHAFPSTRYVSAGLMLLACAALPETRVSAQSTIRPAVLARPVAVDELEQRFDHPPPEARPQLYWFWMGGQVSKEGITRDLEAMQAAGYGGMTMCHLSDVVTPWAQAIGNVPASEAVAYRSDAWWSLVKWAAQESRRLGLEFGIHNCAGYESSGGPWITPELSMQEVVWSTTTVTGGATFNAVLPRPVPDLHAKQPFPIYNGDTGKLEKPVVPARQTYFKDIAVLAMPADGTVARDRVLDLSNRFAADGTLTWQAPAGDWTVYRFGHTTTGATIQPAQWPAAGLECDKMSREAVEFHLRHILGEARQHLGDLLGNGLTYLWFDSYEAGTPSWTPAMPAEFRQRRGYDLTPFLATMAGRIVGSETETKRFREDFRRTIKDLHRDVYFATIRRECHAAGLQARAEPYEGPWDVAEAVPPFDQVAAEFWTRKGTYSPMLVKEVVAAARAAKMPVITAEAFTGLPRDSQWNETPAWLKPIGDAAYCDGINRLMLHRFIHQPYDDRHRPGVAMGQWGTHVDRFQTWWEPAKAWVAYMQRCQALLQWGEPADSDFAAEGMKLRAIRRKAENADVYFVATADRVAGIASCSFGVKGRRPELWDPVTGTRRDLPQFDVREGRTVVPLRFDKAQSFFVVFRHPVVAKDGPVGDNFPALEPIAELAGPWTVRFDPAWGGPASTRFDTLADWTTHPDPGIRYYSGTATYALSFDLPASRQGRVWLDLGQVHSIARVRLNDMDLGVVWTAPWQVELTPALRRADNRLEIEVTNTWANRLIGDEQHPADMQWSKGDEGFGGPLKDLPDWFREGRRRPSARRLTFTTWNYFNAKSPLNPAGLIGPVRLLGEAPDRP